MTTVSFAPARMNAKLPVLFAFAALASATACSASLHAQAPDPRPAPQIVVSAQGDVEVTPDRARISLGVETEAETAQAAASANAELQTRVLEAIRKAGIAASAIRTTGYNVAPRQEYDSEKRTWRNYGYRVSNIVVVTVDPIARMGGVIDAALAAGANRVAGISFEVKDPTSAREQAITNAVERARREAEVAARAAGGQILGLIELTVNSYDQSPRPMMEMAMMRSDAASTPVSEGTQSVSVGVVTRWEYGPRR